MSNSLKISIYILVEVFGEVWRSLSPHTPLGKNFARQGARKVFLERVFDEKNRRCGNFQF